ncbi:MAG: Uma2 family endonuclease, partial [Cyanobacteria bacterium P01_D01_bin.116]
EKLRGYRLRAESYQLITDNRSEPLKLRLAIEGELIGFYREDTGEKLLIPDELATKLQQETERANEAEALLARYRERFGDLNE